MSNQTMSGKTNYNVDPNHIYYDVQLFNNDTSNNPSSLPLKFEETRTAVVLANPSEYFMSVQRFSIDTTSLPLFIPQVDTNPDTNTKGDPDQLIYKIFIYGVGSTPFNIKYIPSDSTLTPPDVLNNPDALSDPYYFVYTYQKFIDMINRSLIEYFLNFDDGVGANLCWTPQLVLNRPSGKIDIWFPDYTTPNSGGQAWNIAPYGGFGLFFNSSLFTLFSSLNSYYVGNSSNNNWPFSSSLPSDDSWYGVNPTVSSIDYSTSPPFNSSSVPWNSLQADIPYPRSTTYTEWSNSVVWPFPNQTSNPVYPANLVANITNFQFNRSAYASTPIWNPVKRIVLVSNILPITNNLEAPPNIYNSNTALDLPYINNNFSPTISDIEIPLVKGNETKPIVYYTPMAEFKLIDLQSNAPFINISFTAYWVDARGVKHPLLLDSGCGASVKILFRRKIFNLIKLPDYTKPV